MDILRGLIGSDRKVDEVLRGLDVVRTLLANIDREPEEPKWQRLRLGNSRIAALRGLEEEGLLRAAGFASEPAGEDGQAAAAEADAALVYRQSDASHGSGADGNAAGQASSPLQCLREVLETIEVVCRALRAGADSVRGAGAAPTPGASGSGEAEAAAADCPAEAAAETPAAAATPPPGDTADVVCNHPLVAQALEFHLECWQVDRAAQQSRESAEADKRRRRADEATAVRSADRWREALDRAGGAFLCDGGAVEAWLQRSADHRAAAHDLLELQAAAARWYGEGARSHCDRFRGELQASGATAADAGVDLQRLVEAELSQMREALFAFPEAPGSAPRLFRLRADTEDDDVSGGVALPPTRWVMAMATNGDQVLDLDLLDQEEKEGST